MCDPLTIGSIALSAGSAIANSMANSAVQQARDDAMAAERIRQRQFDDEAQGFNKSSQDRYEDFGGQQDERSKKLGDYFAEEVSDRSAADAAAVEGTQSVAPTSSNITIREEQNQRDQARAFTDQQGRALGDLRAFGDLLGGIGRLQSRDATSIGQVAGFKRGSQNVLPFELEEANRAGDSMRMFGDILGGFGSIGLQAGLGGGSLFGGAGAGAAAAPRAPMNISPLAATPRAGMGLIY